MLGLLSCVLGSRDGDYIACRFVADGAVGAVALLVGRVSLCQQQSGARTQRREKLHAQFQRCSNALRSG